MNRRLLGRRCLNPAVHFIVDVCYDEATIVWCIIICPWCIGTARMLISVIET